MFPPTVYHDSPMGPIRMRVVKHNDGTFSMAQVLTDANGDPIGQQQGSTTNIYANSYTLNLPQPTVFKTINTQVLTTVQTIWTPSSGKRFRLMGGFLTVTVATGNIQIRDGGSTVILVPALALATNIQFDLGAGYLSTAINNTLQMIGPALMVASGTVWGTEE